MLWYNNNIVIIIICIFLKGVLYKEKKKANAKEKQEAI